MITEPAFNSLVDEIRTQGYDEQAAAHLAALIGDTPVIDQDGRIVLMEKGRQVAVLRPLRFFARSNS